MFDSLKIRLIDRLKDEQQPTGQFRTFARPSQGDSFFIGDSPFATALIVHVLTGIENSTIRSILYKAVENLDSMDPRGRRLFKFWYPGSVIGTGHPFLPFDLDDTSIVNTALHLHGHPSLDTAFLERNKNANGTYYTWLQPSVCTLVHYPWLADIYAGYLKLLPLFLTNAKGRTMAVFRDSEAIVNMNVLTYCAIKGDDVVFSFPVEPEDVKKDLANSLHYDNIAIYYLSLAKLFKHAGMKDDGALARAIREVLASEMCEEEYSNTWVLLMSLIYVDELNDQDKASIDKLAAMQDLWVDTGIDLCVGNKTYPSFHTYWSSDLTHSLAFAVLHHI